MKIDHILVPYNAAPHANQALLVAMDLAEKYQADILVVYINPVGTVSLRPHQTVVGEGSLTTPTIPTPRTTASNVNRGIEIMNIAKKITEKSKIKIKFEIRQGSRTSEIVKLAQQNIDLIVVGVRSTMRVRKIFFGNVATSLINEAPCSVLIVRTQEEDINKD